MNPAARDVLDAALALPEDDRAKLAQKLVESLSLDGEVDTEAEETWAAEIEWRVGQMAAGQAGLLEADDTRMHRAAHGR